jgi:hypothetical protein
VVAAVSVTFLVVVLALTLLSRRRGHPAGSCCAPADPADDLRMRPAFEPDSSTER